MASSIGPGQEVRWWHLPEDPCRHRVLRGRAGKALAYAGLGVISFGGFLGGHMSSRQSLGANHAEDVPYRVEPGWHAIGTFEDLPEGSLERRILDEVPLVVFRRGSEMSVRSDTCTHLSGPLNGRRSRTRTAIRASRAPWHNSTFSLRNGDVVQGPATSPQPSFLTRVVVGTVEVSLPNAG